MVVCRGIALTVVAAFAGALAETTVPSDVLYRALIEESSYSYSYDEGPSGAGAAVVVEASVSLDGITVEAFDTAAQAVFVDAVVTTLDTVDDSDQVTITSVVATTDRRRRLTGGIEVAYEIRVPLAEGTEAEDVFDDVQADVQENIADDGGSALMANIVVAADNAGTAVFDDATVTEVTVPTEYTTAVVTCAVNEYVSNNVCTACAAGTGNAAGDDASGADTACTVIICGENQSVVSHVCTDCPEGTANAAGDDASGDGTICDTCAENYFVSSKSCTACLDGGTRAAGDDRTGRDTVCTPAEPKDGNEFSMGVVLVVIILAIVVGLGLIAVAYEKGVFDGLFGEKPEVAKAIEMVEDRGSGDGGPFVAALSRA